jgi:phosphoglucomutase
LKRLGEIVDLNVIRTANLRVCFDPMWGAARGYSDEFLAEAGVKVWTVRDYRGVLFGGHAPEPDDHLLLDDLRDQMRATGAQIGIATDGDADRFGIVDGDLQPNYVIAPLFDYLVESRGWKNGVAKSAATANLINAIAKARGYRSAITRRRKTEQAWLLCCEMVEKGEAAGRAIEGAM